MYFNNEEFKKVSSIKLLENECTLYQSKNDYLLEVIDNLGHKHYYNILNANIDLFKEVSSEYKEITTYYELQQIIASQFYTSNLKNGYNIAKRAAKNLIDNQCYNVYDLLFVNNYNEVGLVENVAKNEYYFLKYNIMLDDDIDIISDDDFENEDYQEILVDYYKNSNFKLQVY